MRTRPLSEAIRLALLAGVLAPGAAAGSERAGATPPERGSIVTAARAASDVVLTREQLERAGYVSLGDVLQRLPQHGSALNPLYNGGNGEHRVDLRQLGPQRTLVLVDGRRWIQGPGGATDLTTIPWAAIERVEVRFGSDAARHGSGAIAGTINVVLRRDFTGAEARSWYGRYDEGDGTTQAHDVTLGAAGDRGHVVLGAEYADQEPILAADRAISTVPLFGFGGNSLAFGASTTTPFGRFGVPGIPGSVTLIPGEDGAQASDFRPFNPTTDSFNFARDEVLLTLQERVGLFASGRYAVTEATSFEATVVYHERRSERRFAALPITLGQLFGIPVTLSAQNLYNPFGVDLRSRIQYRPGSRYPRTFQADVDTFHFDGGFDGTFELGTRSFAWNVGYTYADRERRDVTRGFYDRDRLREGLGPSFIAADGTPTCGTLAAPIAGCVPINFFGGPDGFTDAMARFAGVTLADTEYTKQYAYHADLSGALVELPAGPLEFALGYEHRRESGYTVGDALRASGATSGAAPPPIAGGFSLDELHTEFNVPLLKGLAFAQSLDLALAARGSDYSTFGDTTNVAVGFRWQPFADLLVHGEYADGFRAPAIVELFSGNVDAFPAVTDPCGSGLFAAGGVDQATRDRCLDGIVDADGRLIPGVSPGYEQGQITRATIGGNPDLAPEQARTRRLGLRYQPSRLEGVEAYLDWYRIDVTGTIGYRSAERVVFDCYARQDLVACTRVTRGPTSELIDVFAGSQNLPGRTEVEGYDLGVRYRFTGAWGDYDLRWDNAYVSFIGSFGEPDFGPLVGDRNARGNRVGRDLGSAPYWRLRSSLSADWRHGDFGATLAARYFAALDEDCSFTANAGRPELCSNPQGSPQNPFGENRLDDVWYFDLQARWDAPWDARISAGVRNLFAQDPPVLTTGLENNFDPAYEVPGRFLYVSYAQRF